jgi:hypothetical protein
VQAARRQEGREAEALRLSLTVEVRRLVNILIETHRGFGLATGRYLRADDVVKQTSRGVPVVYPATADRVGLLGSVAQYVVTFYANVKDIEFAGRMIASDPAELVPRKPIHDLRKLIEKACQSALPLLNKLPQDKDDPDTERKAKIAAMGALAKPSNLTA